MTSTEKFLINWDGFHKNISNSFSRLRDNHDFADVTLVCEDNINFEAHRMILSSTSTFFRSLLKRVRTPHPIIYLRGVRSEKMGAILDFIYNGQVNILQKDVKDLLDLAQDLSVKGLSESSTNNEDRSMTNQRSPMQANSVPLTTTCESQEQQISNTNAIVAASTYTEIQNDVQEALPTSFNTLEVESEDEADVGFISQAFDHTIFKSSQKIQVLTAKEENGGAAYQLKICDGIQISSKVATKDAKSNRKIVDIIKKGEKCMIEIKYAYVKNGIIVLQDFDIVKFCGYVTTQSSFVKYVIDIDKKKREAWKAKHGDKKTTIIDTRHH